MGIFGEWQPRYAAYGVATFPVSITEDEKKPSVRNYQKVGLSASAKFARRFGDKDALGFMCGRRSRVTVLDIDTPDERVLAEALDRHGQTPIVARSGSGNFQAWYRWNSEPRKIRPWGRDLPIDLLGGGYVVAPPSRGNSAEYKFIQGRLEELSALPSLSGIEDILNSRPGSEPNGEHSQPAFVRILGHTLIHDGQRHVEFHKRGLRAAIHAADFDEFVSMMRAENAQCVPPLPERDLLDTARSVWGYETTSRRTGSRQNPGENWAGAGHIVTMPHPYIDLLAAGDPFAFALLNILRQRHWGRDEFHMGKGMADALEWTVPRFLKARERLVEEGFITCVHPGGRGPGDPPLFRWGRRIRRRLR